MRILSFNVKQHLAIPALAVTLVVTLAAMLLSGCSASDRKPYAVTYESALQRYHGSETRAASTLQRSRLHISEPTRLESQSRLAG